MTGRPRLAVLADHGPGVGAGHLARCLALVQAWVSGGDEAVVVDEPTLPVEWSGRYADAGAVRVDRVPEGSVVVVDGARRGADVASRLRDDGHRVLVIDDHGARGAHEADWILDPNLGAEPEAYADRPADSRLLLGARYTLLRAEVVAARPVAPPDRSLQPRRLLVAAGGDPTAEVDAFFREVADDPRLAALGLAIVPLRDVVDVGAVLAGVDLAVSAAGGTTWELCLHGVPAVLVPVVDDQVPVAARVAAAGVAVDAGRLGTGGARTVAGLVADLAGDTPRRVALADAARRLVDGLGARRVAAVLRAAAVSLRRAEADDARLVWAWANDPDARRASFHTEAIPWDTHERWFQGKLADPDAALWIAQDAEGRPVGQVRVDLLPDAPGTGEVGVSLAPDRRGQGWAAPVLVAAADRAFAEFPPDRLATLLARVRPGNEASRRAFTTADFDPGPDGSGPEGTWHSYTRARHG